MVSSFPAALALGAAGMAGLDASRIAARAGLAKSDVSDPDVSIPLARLEAVWTAIADEPGGMDVGLACLDAVRLSVGGALGYIMRNAETVGHAFGLLVSLGRFVGQPLVPRVEVSRGRFCLSQRWTGVLAENRPFGESANANVIGICRELTGTKPTPIEIRYQFSRPPDPERSTRAFGCPASYGCKESLIAFPAQLARQPVKNRDPRLFAILERSARRLDRAPLDTKTLVADVRTLVQASLPEGEPSIAGIAKKLAMSTRTLQRRLASDGVTVSVLVDGLRRELSMTYLDDRLLGLSEIAFMLGYSDATAFQRAFRRWTGKAPAACRKERRAGQVR